MINLRILSLAGGCAVILFSLSFAHPFGNPRSVAAPSGPLLAGAQIPDLLRELMGRKCGNCHSDAVEWPLYSRLAPVSWLVERDVSEAREHMNLSRWSTYTSQDKAVLLSRLAAEASSGEMPPARYVAIHRDSELTTQERDSLYEWARVERKRLKIEAQEAEGGK